MIIDFKYILRKQKKVSKYLKCLSVITIHLFVVELNLKRVDFKTNLKEEIGLRYLDNKCCPNLHTLYCWVDILSIQIVLYFLQSKLFCILRENDFNCRVLIYFKWNGLNQKYAVIMMLSLKNIIQLYCTHWITTYI